MKWIDFEKPKSIDEAVKLLSGSSGNARAMAGGTDLIVQLRVGDPRVNADVVVDIKSVPELNELSYSSDKGLTIGAAVECYKIYNNENVKKHYPAILDSATLIGGTQIQGRATFGGNLCNAAPSGDAIPNLIAKLILCQLLILMEMETYPGLNLPRFVIQVQTTVSIKWR